MLEVLQRKVQLIPILEELSVIISDLIRTEVNLLAFLFLVSQKEIIAQMGSLIAEIYSWKSLSIGQPILRLHTTATKAALLTLPPG
jgi:hypothetical protein